MTMIGYARVSTTDQDLTIQLAALNAAGCEVIRQEKASGTTIAWAAATQDRPRVHRGPAQTRARTTALIVWHGLSPTFKTSCGP